MKFLKDYTKNDEVPHHPNQRWIYPKLYIFCSVEASKTQCIFLSIDSQLNKLLFEKFLSQDYRTTGTEFLNSAGTIFNHVFHRLFTNIWD